MWSCLSFVYNAIWKQCVKTEWLNAYQCRTFQLLHEFKAVALQIGPPQSIFQTYLCEFCSDANSRHNLNPNLTQLKWVQRFSDTEYTIMLGSWSLRTSLRVFTTELTFLGTFLVYSRPNYDRAERLAGHCAFQGENFEAGNMARYGSRVISGGRCMAQIHTLQ